MEVRKIVTNSLGAQDVAEGPVLPSRKVKRSSLEWKSIVCASYAAIWSQGLQHTCSWSERRRGSPRSREATPTSNSYAATEATQGSLAAVPNRSCTRCRQTTLPSDSSHGATGLDPRRRQPIAQQAYPKGA